MKNIRILLLYLLTISIAFHSFSFINIGKTSLLRPPWFFAGLPIVILFLGVFLGKQKIKINIVGKAVLILNLIAILSLVNLYNAKTSQMVDFFTKWIQLVFCSFLFFAISNLKINKQQLKKIFKIWIYTAFFISLYAIYQSLGRNLNLPFPLLYLSPADHFLATKMTAVTFGSFVRCSSFFTEPSFLGSYLIAPILFFSINIAYKSKEYLIFKTGPIRWLIFSTIICAFILSFTLAAYITVAIMCVFILLSKKMLMRGLKVGLITSTVIFCIILGLRFINVDFLSGFSRVKKLTTNIAAKSVSTGAFRQRLLHNLRALKIWKDHPLLGVGINNVPYYHSSYSPPDWLKGRPIEETGSGNMWTMAIAEMGFFAFVGLAFLWISALLKMKHYIKLALDNSSIFLSLTFYYILLGEIVNSLFTHQFIHIQRWFYLSLTVLVMFYIDSVINRNNNVIETN